MKPQIYEGTWEELLLRSSELAGHRVRLTVLGQADAEQPKSLATVLQGRVGNVQFQPSTLSGQTGEAFADVLASQRKSTAEDS